MAEGQKIAIATYLDFAISKSASDVHITVGVPVMVRIDGNLIAIPDAPVVTPEHVLEIITTFIPPELMVTLKQRREVDFSFGYQTMRFRANVYYQKNYISASLRLLPKEIADFKSLGLPPILEKFTEHNQGFVIITGPTGSGKSTTLAAMLKRMNTEDINIVTLEDPIEYFVDGVNQSQIHEEIGYTFAEGLRHILRQDPDVVMVGEIRDKETAGLATQAALTGHIVLSTLHTNDAIGVVPRLIDMGVEKYLIPSTLNVAAAQRLLRRLCPDCKLKATANAGETKLIETAIKDMPEQYQKQYLAKSYEIYKPNLENPCKTCGGKAYRGRIGICETLEMTPEFEKIILGTISESAMRQEAKRQGMLTMYQDGILKVLQGIVSLEELLEIAQAGESA